MRNVDQDARALRALPWVEKVQKRYGHYTLITREGALRARVETGVTVEAGGWVIRGMKLRKPILVPLPSYRIKLGGTPEAVRITLTKRPDVRGIFYYPYPTNYHQRHVSNWRQESQPCFGDYERDYTACASYLARANLMAIFLQTGMPERDSCKGLGKFAYHLGLLPDSAIKQA